MVKISFKVDFNKKGMILRKGFFVLFDIVLENYRLEKFLSYSRLLQV